MPLGHWNVQWLNHNSQRAYPLVDWASAEDKSGTITIPEDFILALYFPVHAGINVAPENFFIKQLVLSATGYTVILGYDDGSSLPPTVASVNISAAAHEEYQSYALVGVNSFDDSVGKISIGKLDTLSTLPAGSYTFDPSGSALEVDAIRPMVRGISSLSVINASDKSERVYGDIELIAGANMRIVTKEGEDGITNIEFSAISGEGLNEECVCDDDEDGGAATEAQNIKFINGIPPLPDGNFRIVGSQCINVEPISHGLSFNDVCSAPCCGCEELDALIRQIERFADGAVTLNNFATNLGAEVGKMNQVVLGSKLNDNGCTECV